jgi:hypothetical protein
MSESGSNLHWGQIMARESGLVVMPSNNSGMQIGYLAGKFPKRLGWLISPDGWRKPPSWMPYALDNGAFGAWSNQKPWDEGKFMDLLERSRSHFRPLWVVVPDVVADREATLELWGEWFPRVRQILPHIPLAFAVQDGMTKADVPSNADVVFVGGTTEWKWRNLREWTENFPRVHVARVNSERLLWMADKAGAESCDGTGWMRGGEDRIEELQRYLEMSTRGDQRPQMIMEGIL